MPDATFACPKCRAVFAVAPGNSQIEAECPECASALDAYFFPAFFRRPEAGVAPAALLDETEAGCFYHPQKQAAQVCDGCGRLICALCSIELGERHVCPACLSSGKKKGKITTLESGRTRYDSIALSLAIFGGFLGLASCGVLTAIMAPAAIYMAIRHWNSPGSLLGVSKGRFVLAIVIAVVELLAGIGILLAVFLHRGKCSAL